MHYFVEQSLLTNSKKNNLDVANIASIVYTLEFVKRLDKKQCKDNIKDRFNELLVGLITFSFDFLFQMLPPIQLRTELQYI